MRLRRLAFLKKRKVWLAVGAAAAALLGAEKIGVSQVAPGPDLNVQCSRGSIPQGSQLTIQKDAGDVTGWLRLIIRVPTAPASTEFQSWLSNGPRLASVASSASQSGHYVIDIGSAAVAGFSGVQPFVWPVGTTINVLVPIQLAAVTDWEVFTSANGTDSLKKRFRRRIWNWSLVALLALAAIGAAVGVVGEKAPPVTAQGCVAGIIESMESDEDAKIFLRTLLIERSSVDEALEAAGVKRARRVPFVFKAQSAFRARLEFLIEDLNGYPPLLP